MLLDHPEEAQRLGQQAAVRARIFFDWERIVDRFEALCERVMEKRNCQRISETD